MKDKAALGHSKADQFVRPNFAQQAVALTKAVVEHVADRGRQAPTEVQAERLTICQACPHSSKEATACSACGCGVIGALSFVGLNMVEKRSWASSRCPLKEPKWDAV